ncbi:MAG: MBL fold metallo-hydrolase, partial [candidate division WOR-3 bacterium]|nr:MBL fold metallo-hydrolase [candidate division WOR-3 bacterium]
AIIDPGFEALKILTTAQKLAGKITHIINTHGHMDHIGANRQLKAESGAMVYIHKDDAELLTHPSKNLSLLIGDFVSSPPADVLLDDGDTIKIGNLELKVLHTPGHTPGSICLIGDKFCFTGDTLFYDSIGRTDFPGSSEELMFKSLKKLSTVLTDELIVYPGHGEWGIFRDIKLQNPFLRCLD